ncbi:MAG: GAF domain-containing protein [Myxococcota bacterium]
MADPKGGDEPESRWKSREDFLTLFKRGQEFTEELLQENERLRFQVASLEEEITQLKRRLETDVVRDLKTQLQQLEQDRQRMLDHFRKVEEENRDFTTQYAEIEEAHNNLANLYVASFQLHSTMAFPEVMQIVSEILLNLIGAEDFCIYLLDDETKVLNALIAEGRDAADYPAVKLGEGVVGKAVADKKQHVAEKMVEGSPTNPLAVIPLAVGEERIGAIVLVKLLTQKPALSSVDFELFQLLGAHAATAIMSSSRLQARPVRATRELYEKLWSKAGRQQEGA